MLDASKSSTDILDARGWFLRGNALYTTGDYEEALAAYDRSLELRPDHPDTLNNRGAALANLERYEEALAANDRSLEVRPDHPDTLYNKVCTYALMGRFPECLLVLEQALERGYSNRRHLLTDADFEGPRADPEFGPRFRALIEKYLGPDGGSGG